MKKLNKTFILHMHKCPKYHLINAIYIDKKSESLKLIQKLRDEAHRFSLRQYRTRRDNQFIDSELINIDGIGEKTAVSLMKKFKSVKNIKSKSLNDLKIAIGDKKGIIIYNYYNK